MYTQNTILVSILVIVIVLGSYFLIKLSSRELHDFTYTYPENYSAINQKDGSVWIESPIDKSKFVFDGVYRKESIYIQNTKNWNWESLALSGDDYPEPQEFNKDYFERLGWKVKELEVAGLLGFKITRKYYGNNIFIIVKYNNDRYLSIHDYLMGDNLDTPGLDMILATLRPASTQK